MKHHVIYVPGLGDDVLYAQSTAVKLWRLYGVRGHFHAMPWRGEEAYGPKFQRLLSEIDKYSQDGQVHLVGASAGASAILNALVERPDKIGGVVLICPKINNPETVSQKSYQENPAFKESLEQLQTNLKKLTASQKSRQILNYYSPGDGSISHEGSTIPGVPERRLPALRHGYAIVYAITFGAPGLMRFLKHID